MNIKIIMFPTNIDTVFLSKKVLKNEPVILKKYSSEYGDGSTMLGPDSLTSRFSKFNVLKWWGTRKLKQKIRLGYERYTGIEGTPLYIQCWANVMRNGQKIEAHQHSQDIRDTEDFLCGNLPIQVDGTTSTYYLDTNQRPQDTEVKPICNMNGQMTIFPGHLTHWTDKYVGNDERVTIAFDILSERYFEESMNRPDVDLRLWGDNFVRI